MDGWLEIERWKKVNKSSSSVHRYHTSMESMEAQLTSYCKTLFSFGPNIQNVLRFSSATALSMVQFVPYSYNTQKYSSCLVQFMQLSRFRVESISHCTRKAPEFAWDWTKTILLMVTDCCVGVAVFTPA